MANEDKKNITRKNLFQALGVGSFFLALAIFISPGTRLWGLGYGFFFLFGELSSWFVLPFAFLLFLYFAWKGSFPRKLLPWRVCLGLLLFFLGLSGLLTHLSFAGKESFASFAPYFDTLHAYRGNAASGIFLSQNIGGGIVGYLIAAIFASLGGAFVYLFTIVLLLAGAILIFYHPLLLLIKSTAQKARTRKALRSSQKETSSFAPSSPLPSGNPIPSEETPLGIAQGDASLTPEPALLSPAAPLEEEHREEEAAPAMSRSQKYAAEKNGNYPHEMPNPDFVPYLSSSEMAHAGLTEAVYIPDSAAGAAYERQQMAKATPSFSIPVEKPAPNEVPLPSVEPAVSPSIPSNAPIATPAANEVDLSGKLYEAPISNEVPLPATPAEAPSPAPVSPSPVPSPAISDSVLSDFIATEKLTPSVAAPVTPSVSEAPAPAPVKEASVVETPLEEAIPTPSAKPVKEKAIEPVIAPLPTPTVAKVTPTPVSPAPAQSAPVSEEKPAAPAIPEGAQPKAKPLPVYTFPTSALLKTYPDDGNKDQKTQECVHRQELINQALSDLGVGAQAISFTIGPSVTRFDLQTNPNVSVSSIGKYIQDISIRLGGVAARFEEVVRGKATSGLEIANQTPTIVSLKEMIDHLPTGPKNNMVIPFGKSISGDYIYSDLSDFPHMLVAGTTGSGKSIFMHGVIMALIMRNRPEDLKLVVVDPKRVEMAKYKDLPHLLCPIVKEASQAKVCFQKLIDEMERRYTVFENSGVSNIRQFNGEYAPSAGVEKLPFIVVVIDEYADLVDSCKDLGDSVVRLAQKARAAGIHLVIATQRPSVQVITGVIKANLPCRVALSMNNATDSMTILGEGGAEELAGHGDMLVDCSQVARNGFTRCQGCLVDNGEIKAVVDMIKAQQGVNYDPRFLDLVDHEAEEKAAAAAAPTISRSELRQMQGDDMYQSIKESIMTQEYTSISRIQRDFGVGFPRAGKIFARLQADGIVASAPETASSSKGCKVLIHSADQVALNANAGSGPTGGDPQ